MRTFKYSLLLGFVLCSLSVESFAQSFTVLHSFSTNADGQNPLAGVSVSGDTLYGATLQGDNGSGYDSGVIYSVSTNGSNYTILHSFQGPDGLNPISIPVISGGNIYGTAGNGGTNSGQVYHQGGVIYSMNTNGSNFTLLHSFDDGPGGIYPQSDLLLSGSTLYGTTAYENAPNLLGAVFSIDISGSNFTVLHVFSNSFLGAQPSAGQLVLSGGTLYGTTAAGGTNNLGIIYALTADGSNFMILHHFAAATGASPVGNLVLSSNTLYGTTELGGSNSLGTIFSIGTDGSNYRQLHAFNSNSDGNLPQGSLTLSGNTLYGTASSGGSGNSGTVFAMNTDGSSYQVLYNFGSTNGDGSEPLGTLLLSGSQLFGVAATGGSNGVGTLFTLSSLLPAPAHPVFFAGEIPLQNGIYYLRFPDGNLFGYYSYDFFPYLYHQDLGFEYFFDANDGHGDCYLYDFTSNDFWYTGPTLFPYMYNFTLNAWLYYFPDAQTPGRYSHNPRSFHNFGTGQNITR